MVVPLFSFVRAHGGQPTLCVSLAAISAFFAFFFLFVHGVVPLQADAVRALPTNPPSNATSPTQMTTLVHESSAAAFFLLSYSHAAIVLTMFCASPSLPIGTQLFPASTTAKLAALSISVAVLFIPFAPVPLPKDATADQRAVNVSGIMQWTAVGSLIAFYATYAIDFWRIKSLVGDQSRGPLLFTGLPSSLEGVDGDGHVDPYGL